MESELKDLNSHPAKPDRDDGPASKDDRPLLKSDTNSSVAEELQELEKKCAAYVRRDVYGTMGRGGLPVKEKVLLGLALVTLVPIRVVLATTVLVLYYLISRICTLFKVPNRDEQEQEDYAHMDGWRGAVIVQCGRALSRVMLVVFGFYWISETSSDSDPKPAAQMGPKRRSLKDQGRLYRITFRIWISCITCLILSELRCQASAWVVSMFSGSQSHQTSRELQRGSSRTPIIQEGSSQIVA